MIAHRYKCSQMCNNYKKDLCYTPILCKASFQINVWFYRLQLQADLPGFARDIT